MFVFWEGLKIPDRDTNRHTHKQTGRDGKVKTKRSLGANVFVFIRHWHWNERKLRFSLSLSLTLSLSLSLSFFLSLFPKISLIYTTTAHPWFALESNVHFNMERNRKRRNGFKVRSVLTIFQGPRRMQWSQF